MIAIVELLAALAIVGFAATVERRGAAILLAMVAGWLLGGGPR